MDFHVHIVYVLSLFNALFSLNASFGHCSMFQLSLMNGRYETSVYKSGIWFIENNWRMLENRCIGPRKYRLGKWETRR